MIRVTVDLVPFGEDAAARQLATIEIGNIGRIETIVDGDVARYECRLVRPSLPPLTTHLVHDRAQGWGVLVGRALKAWGPEVAAMGGSDGDSK